MRAFGERKRKNEAHQSFKCIRLLKVEGSVESEEKEGEGDLLPP
jgi:hypothetical protein